MPFLVIIYYTLGNNYLDSVKYALPSATTAPPTATTEETTTSTPSDTTGTTTDPSNYADSQHQCDTGMVWNDLINGCIAAGPEDKYILKSDIVLPVCPACPQPITCSGGGKKKTCGSCPSCGSCPNSSDFDCKKVPNYDYPNNTALPTIPDSGLFGEGGPIPLLADFSAISS